MSASLPVRVPPDAYAELERLQAEWQAEHPGGTISLGTIVARLLADRKAAKP